MTHIKSLLEQIKINYQINDMDDYCYRSLVGVESYGNWAVGGKVEMLVNKEFKLFLPGP